MARKSVLQKGRNAFSTACGNERAEDCDGLVRKENISGLFNCGCSLLKLGLRCLRSLEIINNDEHLSIFLHGLHEKATGMTKVSFSARHFILARPSGNFDVLREEECPPVKLRVEIVFVEESCQFGAIYKRKHRMFSYHISSNNLCGSVVNKMATMNIIYKCIIVVLFI